MNKKKLIVPLIFLVAAAFYFVFFYKSKTLKFVPENADAVVLIDMKKLTRQYISNLITHPAKWSDSKKKKDKKTVSLKDSGIRIPDFLQIFHLKDTKFSEWYTVVELKDLQKFSAFLKNNQFVSKGKNTFQKDQIFIKIEGENCIVGTSASAFENIDKLFQSFEKKTLDADQFISNSLGSISFISGKKIQNFSIELKADEIEIKNTPESEDFTSIVSGQQQKNYFLDAELDTENIKHFASLFNKSIRDSAQINYFKATADLEQVNDTIISYEYDDNFNEIEKKTYQKIIQPNYVIDLQSQNPGKTWDYFQHKKWINAQDQFIGIPFQPNHIDRNDGGFIVKSTRKSIVQSPKLKENYIFFRNSPLLLSSLSTLTATEKKLLSDIDYIFYGNKAQNYWMKIKAKKSTLPLILRW
ncbi:hypothetical protein ACQWU4_09675 [Chryseobacterium sp. MIQD13]|uniref:hypothetical protein n=1 Tax=Chryseobacterium sp. MIQD13 TaxID=3422310 RepID=UPI003D29FDA0